MAALRQAVLLAAVPDEPRDHRVPGWLRRTLLRGLARDPRCASPLCRRCSPSWRATAGNKRMYIGLGAAALAALAAGAFAYRWYLLRGEEARQAAPGRVP
ncbi:MAG: hypothetical protein IPG88_13170 [Gemmatimonadetes bacterium]|nr:hypothetical protein [Gemmatimonadota bacterium]